MSSLADLPELVGFFSYSRDDDDDSSGDLSALRQRIQRELRGQLGRPMTTFRLWQDKEAIAPGKLWEEEIKAAAGQAVFFIPILTPTVVRSTNCKFELDAFLGREKELGRNDLVFPIYYITVPELEDKVLRQSDPVISAFARRQYLDWRDFRHQNVNSQEVKEAVEQFCKKICEALRRPWISPEERKRREEAAAQQKGEAGRAAAALRAKADAASGGKDSQSSAQDGGRINTGAQAGKGSATPPAKRSLTEKVIILVCVLAFGYVASIVLDMMNGNCDAPAIKSLPAGLSQLCHAAPELNPGALKLP